MKILGAILMVVGALVILYTRLTNIDMTETRLLIEYYREYIAAVALLLTGYFLFTKDTE